MNLIRKFNPQQLYIDGVLGQYSLGVTTSLINVGTTGELFQFRWSDSSRLAVIQRVNIMFVSSAAQAALSVAQVDLIRATGWTVQGTSGVAIDMTTGSNKRRAAMPTSLIPAGDIRWGTPCGVGTKTLDANSLASLTYSGSANPQFAFADLVKWRPGDNEYPLVLQPNDGFVLKIITGSAAGDGAQASINIEWMECNPS
jgi:hypothetical protein